MSVFVPEYNSFPWNLYLSTYVINTKPVDSKVTDWLIECSQIKRVNICSKQV